MAEPSVPASNAPAPPAGKRAALLAALGLSLLFLLASGAPAGRLLPDPAAYLAVHNIAETLSVVIAAMVFGVGWQLRRYLPNRSPVLLGCVFLAVAIVDFAHTLSFPGMPELVTPSNTEKAINFWLAARTLTALGMLAIALHPEGHWSRLQQQAALLLALLVAGLILWIGLWHAGLLPRTFEAPQGLTPFKIGAEYGLAALYALSAARFLCHKPHAETENLAWLAAACWTLGLAELFLTLYATATDLFNLLGHIYKILAYLMVFQSLLVVWLRRPLRELELERSRLKTLLASLPHLIWLKDADGVYLACNRMFERFFGAREEQIIGKTDFDFVEPELARFFRAHDQRAIDHGGPSVNEEWLTFREGGYHGLFKTTKTPMHDSAGQVIGVLGVAHDITEQRQTEERLQIAAIAFEAQEGMLVADAGRNILRVNSALCAISGYSTEELIGQSVEMLRSPRQNPAIYDEINRVIQRDRAWSGEFCYLRKNGEDFPAWLTITAILGDDGHIRHYVSTLIDISERKRAEEEIHHLAFYDPLTGLPNRRLLQDRLNQWQGISRRNDVFSALLLIDLDNFKTLNDVHGHDVGDRFLQEIARRLIASVRSTDTIARLGGDEFVAILNDLGRNEASAAAQTEALAHKLLDALSRPYQIGLAEHRGSGSIGATLFRGASITPEDLLKQADLAMYSAKEGGRGAMHFFDPAMQAAVLARASLETDLAHAIESGELQLHYQPQLTRGEHVTGAEVLLRWQHPTRGMVPPAQFIPLAEESGKILEIGHWVLQETCRQLSAWQQMPGLQALRLSVNISIKQIRQPDFVADVTELIRQTGVNPFRLKLELTESLFADEIEPIIASMEQLKTLGISFALDDFGTGYSSLSCLRRLPLNQLKIDQSFIRDIMRNHNDAAIARTIVALANTLGLEVIAEGVETTAQRDFLSHIGCHDWQGYLFSPAVPASEFMVLALREPASA